MKLDNAILLIFSLLSLLWATVVQPVQAVEPTETKAVCAEWASDAGPWKITRCEGDWGEVCFMANSGMMDCHVN